MNKNTQARQEAETCPKQEADAVMQVEIPIKDRLAQFWETTAKEVSRQYAHEIDHANLHDPQYVSEFAEQITKHMLETEHNHLPLPNYMRIQTDINEKMRGILVDWVIEVHLRFKLLPETLFLTVNFIDRYCEKVQVHRTKLQLVAVAAMLIASKYEEIYAPMVRDFVYITDNAYSREEILETECRMLNEF